jgi:hypothetical protein
MVPTAPLQCVVQGDFKLGTNTRMISSLDGLYSSELGPPTPQASEAPPPRTQVGGDTLACGGRNGGVQFQRRDRNSGNLCLLIISFRISFSCEMSSIEYTSWWVLLQNVASCNVNVTLYRPHTVMLNRPLSSAT